MCQMECVRPRAIAGDQQPTGQTLFDSMKPHADDHLAKLTESDIQVSAYHRAQSPVTSEPFHKARGLETQSGTESGADVYYKLEFD